MTHSKLTQSIKTDIESKKQQSYSQNLHETIQTSIGESYHKSKFRINTRDYDHDIKLQVKLDNNLKEDFNDALFY